MHNAPRRPLYAVDTNVFMDWQARYYPTDIFASITAKVDALIGEGRFSSPALAKEELGVVGTAELTAWADAREGIWAPTEKLLAAALAIQSRFPGCVTPKPNSRKPMRMSSRSRRPAMVTASSSRRRLLRPKNEIRSVQCTSRTCAANSA
jgi:hypothetical protein